jgi:sec-independent protein translocase protein TatA
MFGLGTTELIVIGVIVFLIFGAKRIPEIGKGLGGALREFKQVKKEISTEDAAEPSESGEKKEEGGSSTVESAIKNKVVEQIPGVKKAMNVKKTVDKAKDLLNS